MKRFKRKVMCILAACSLFTVGSCTIDSWNLAVGPGFGGVELELSNGLNILVPLMPFGN